MKTSGLVLGALLGAALTVVVVVGWLMLTAERIPTLTAEDFAAAERLWREKGPANYNLDVEVSSVMHTDMFHLEVRGGKVVVCQRDGVVPRPHTWETWSVEGQFATIERELENATDPKTVFGAPPGTKVLQKAVFDPHYGYPRVYERRVLTTSLAMEWEVIRFEPVNP